MDSTSWLDKLEYELQTIPKINMMQSKSNIYMFEMTDTGRAVSLSNIYRE